MKDVGNLGIGKQRVVRAVRPVHGGDVGQPADAIGAAEIGRDPHTAGRIDVIGGMAGIGDGDVFGLGRQPVAHRHRARRARHRQALAALWRLCPGRAGEQTEQGKRGDQSRHDGPVCEGTFPALYRRIRPPS